MSRKTSAMLEAIYQRLFEAFGPQHWWPAETREEVIIGAILAQNTAWANVARAVERLGRADCLTLRGIDRMPLDRLARLVRPSGTYRIKAERLKTFANWLQVNFDGDLDALFGMGTDRARKELLSIDGIGPETADAILLYAGRLPTFVVDAYTRRIMRRHFVVPPQSTYAQAKGVIERALPTNRQLYNEYHALLVELGKRYCRPRAQCEGCPLAPLKHDPER